MLVINVTIGDTTEHAKSIARNGHDECWKFLGPYGRQVHYLDEHGKNWPNTRIPTLEESMAQGPWVIGSAAEVADNLAQLQDELGVERMTVFQHYPGLVREQVIDQMERFMRDVAQPRGAGRPHRDGAARSDRRVEGGQRADRRWPRRTRVRRSSQ